jgi:DNA repair exonuclease SbcCD nuclease subunit
MESTTAPKGSILIAHIGDVHLRDTQYATAQRGLDFFEAFKRAVKAAKKAGADCIVCTGDNFDMARPSAKVIGQLMQVDGLLKQLGLMMFTITGNHDYSSPSWLSTLFPDTAQTHDSGVVPIDGESVEFKGFRITGIPPYTARTFSEKAAEIENLTRHSDVVLYHGFVTGIVPAYTGDKTVLDVKDLPVSSNNKAILLGDIHVQGFARRDRPGGGVGVLIGYPGSLEMCSKSESTHKSIPMIRVTADDATVESYTPLTIRPYISKVVKTAEELDALIELAKQAADQHPVVLVEFDRSLPQTVARLHAVLDPQRCVIRCYPLPMEKGTLQREAPDWAKATDEEVQLGVEHFVKARFADSEVELAETALRLLYAGDSNTSNIVSDYVEKRLLSMGVRE